MLLVLRLYYRIERNDGCGFGSYAGGVTGSGGGDLEEPSGLMCKDGYERGDGAVSRVLG